MISLIGAGVAVGSTVGYSMMALEADAAAKKPAAHAHSVKEPRGASRGFAASSSR